MHMNVAQQASSYASAEKERERGSSGPSSLKLSAVAGDANNNSSDRSLPKRKPWSWHR